VRILCVQQSLVGSTPGVPFEIPSGVDTIVGFDQQSASTTFTAALTGNPSMVLTDLSAPQVTGIREDVLAFAGKAHSALLRIPVEPREVYYVVFSGQGSAVVYLDSTEF
jgi:hypothetical protein